uniref:hypothetical protein n=1 Tax=Shewanella baltica TaxID=62322 RepID=UPI0040485286
MPITAYSNYFSREISVEQYVNLCKNENLDSDFFCRTDMECPICSVKGGTIVSAARAYSDDREIRQATFRFNNHDPYCDYSVSDNSADSQYGFRINSRKNITTFIAKLTCSGIELGIFTQQTMREFRRWLFSIKKTTSTELEVTPDAIDSIEIILNDMPQTLPYFNEFLELDSLHQYSKNLKIFTPEYISKIKFFKENKSHIDDLFKLRYYLGKDGIKKIRKYYPAINQEEICQYKKAVYALRSCTLFSTENEIKKIMSCNYSTNITDAFFTYLLWVSNWNIKVAIESFIKIKTHTPNDVNLANIIGVNIFDNNYLYKSIELINTKASEIISSHVFYKPILEKEIEQLSKMSQVDSEQSENSQLPDIDF